MLLGHLSGWPFAFLGLGIEHFWDSYGIGILKVRGSVSVEDLTGKGLIIK